MATPLPLIRLSIGRTSGTAHWGVLLGDAPLTACPTHSPDLRPVTGTSTAHQMCQSCTRAFLILTTLLHPSGEPDARPAAGAGDRALAHRPIPGHLLGYCGKPLDARRASTPRICANCTRLTTALEIFQRRAGELVVAPGEPCHLDEALLWAPKGRDNLVTGHRRNSVTGNGYCEQQLAGPNPGASNECARCRRHWQEAEVVRQTYTAPKMRERARWWPQRRELDRFDDRACTLNPGDVYTLSGCDEIHHVVAVADRSRESHTDLLVYLPAEDQVTELRIRRDRLVTIQRPSDPPNALPQPSRLTS